MGKPRWTKVMGRGWEEQVVVNDLGGGTVQTLPNVLLGVGLSAQLCAFISLKVNHGRTDTSSL